MNHSNILGVVLAGGKPQRFGEDKCQVKLGDKLLINYILSQIIDEFKEVLLISNNKIKYNHSNKISLVEDLKKGLGPLRGILTAMKWIKKNNESYKWILTFPSDTPFFKKQHLNNFLEEIKGYEGQLFFINSNDTRHNIFGLWSIDLLDRLEKDLDNGERKVEIWANKIGAKSINMKFENKDPFFNINTKEDLIKEEYLEND